MSLTSPSKLLIVASIQYGYLTDYFYYAKYLADKFDITFLCVDQGKPRFDPVGCDVIYVKAQSRLNRRFDFRRHLRIMADEGRRYDAVITDLGYGFAFFLPLYRRLSDKIIFDIRTLDISPQAFKRRIRNLVLSIDARMASCVTVVSDAVARKLGLKRYSVLPLGTSPDLLLLDDKSFDALRLLYVGTFTGRRIHDTVEGIALFLARNPEWNAPGRVVYDIIGAGDGAERIEQSIARHGLSDVVRMHGYVPNDRLSPYFDRSNIGVSYVPTGEIYQLQPPTKTYEYIGAGMCVIATATAANRAIVDSRNGILIDAAPEAFAAGLERLAASMQRYTSSDIKSTLGPHLWPDIADKLAALISG